MTSKLLIPEEKDLQKLKLQSLKNVLAIPVLDKQNSTPVAVISIYNYDESVYSHQVDDSVLHAFSAFMSGVLFNIDV